ncbi:uncharacterized protein LOC112591241 [Melanaphis sacchari]|uniref:uncharacterized protein LOC112591241 n=1 Tax=Melanaphis sacchari TaxID=742174 RepID=UPI000DC12DD9|nr:uncharacterized protein LOC112591241 [Melanaphis sacchari]
MIIVKCVCISCIVEYEQYSEYKNPAEKVKKNHDAFNQTKNDDDKIMINDQDIQTNVKKDQNSIKNTKFDDIFQTSCKVIKHSVHNKSESSNTDYSNTNITTVSEGNDIINKKVAIFIKKVLHNELPKNKKQFSLVLLAKIYFRKSIFVENK